jgi:serine/threonine protein kinase
MSEGTVSAFLRAYPEHNRVLLVCITALCRDQILINFHGFQALEIVQGVAFMHHLDVVHGDLKAVSVLPCTLHTFLSLSDFRPMFSLTHIQSILISTGLVSQTLGLQLPYTPQLRLLMQPFLVWLVVGSGWHRSYWTVTTWQRELSRPADQRSRVTCMLLPLPFGRYGNGAVI